MDKLSILLADYGLPFTGAVDILNTDLGGSETAAYYMAKSLAALGHEVRVACDCPQPGKFNGVGYYNRKTMWKQLAAVIDPDVFIASRAIEQLAGNFRGRLNAVWCHDYVTEDQERVPKYAWAADKIMVMSKFQETAYRNLGKPGFRPENWDPVMYRTRNGIDYNAIRKLTQNVKKTNKVMYVSRPERGLQVLLENIWPQILKENPDLELHLCTYVNTITLPKEVMEFYQWLDAKVQDSPNTTHLGSLSKRDLYEQIASSQLVLYPCHFPEISCIAAMEAMACGTPIVTTRDFALPETCGEDYPLLISGDPATEEYHEQYITLTNNLLKDRKLYQSAVNTSLKRASELDWSIVAEDWAKMFLAFFEDRFEQNHARIARQLWYYSDIVQANKLAKMYPEECKDILELTDICLRNGSEKPEIYDVDPNDCARETDIEIERELEIQFSNWRKDKRMEMIMSVVPEDTKSLLDVGSHLGMLYAHVDRQFKGAVQYTGIEVSDKLHSYAKQFILKDTEHPGNATLLVGKLQDLPENLLFDVVVCGETLEHIIDTKSFVDALEAHCKPGGKIILTFPSGPLEGMGITNSINYTIDSIAKDSGTPKGYNIHRPQHLQHFELRDVINLFGKKKKFNFDKVFLGISMRGELIGQWIIQYEHDPKRPLGEIDFERKVKLTVPYQWITGCMIIKDEEDWILRALKHMTNVVDELVIYDTGSTDLTEMLVNHWSKDRCWPQVKFIKGSWNDDTGFSGARNESLKHASDKTDWYYWQDADEVVVNGGKLRRYANSKIFPGYIVHQHHLILDLQAAPDRPVRFFRKDTGAQFYGLIHEHPELGLNEPIQPLLTLSDVKIAHYGYLVEAVRRDKCVSRNLPLLLKDREINKDRYLGLGLLMRDYLHIVQWGLAANDKTLTDRELKFLRENVSIYWSVFKEMECDEYLKGFWQYAFTFYQESLKILGEAALYADKTKSLDPPFEVATGLGGGYGGFEQKNLPMDRRWFCCKDEYIEWMAEQAKALSKKLVYKRYIR